MESADLGYAFHDNFAPVGLSVGDTAYSSGTDDSIAFVESMLDTLNKLIADTYAFYEANKRNLETKYGNTEGGTGCIENEAHQKWQKVEPNLTTHVLGGGFCIMDRVKVPMHLNFKSVYFQDFRVACFIMDAGDAKRAKKFMEKKGRSWNIAMIFNFSYIDLRVK